MEQDSRRDPLGQALVSDQAATRLDPPGFDPSRDCPVCKKPLTDSGCIGPYCANNECPVSDDALLWHFEDGEWKRGEGWRVRRPPNADYSAPTFQLGFDPSRGGRVRVILDCDWNDLQHALDMVIDAKPSFDRQPNRPGWGWTWSRRGKTPLFVRRTKRGYSATASRDAHASSGSTQIERVHAAIDTDEGQHDHG